MRLGLSLSLAQARRSGSAVVPFEPCASPNGNAYDPVRLTTAAAYDERDGARVVYFNSTYYLLGGWWPTSPPWGAEVTTNEVWSSPDGVTWTKLLSHVAAPPTSGAGARWRPRHTFGAVVMGGYVWVLGSDQFDGTGWLSDVWRSADPGDPDSWERVAASSPWTAQIPIVTVYNGRIHVLGGYASVGEDFPSSVSSAQHWSTADGETWTEHDDMPFTRAGTDACVTCGLLLIFGGSIGNPYTARTFPTDTWAWNGTMWQQMSATSGGVWEGRDWAATAAYDGKVWLLTGVTDNHVDAPVNLGGAYWTEDLGETWESTYAPWTASHADGVTVGPDGIVLASGNQQGKNVWRLTSEAGTGPHAATLTGWWRAQYRDAPVVGVESAGTSGGRTLAMLSGKSTPGTATILNGLTVEDYNGTDDALTDDVLALDSYVTAGAWWIGLLVWVDSAPAPTVDAYDDEAIISDQNGGWLVAVTSSGVRAVNYDGAYKTTPHAACPSGAFVWVEAWRAGSDLNISVNEGTPQTVAAGNLTSLAARNIRCGVNYDGTKHFDGKVAERMIATARPASMLAYLNARYDLAL
jgi:hypothetical protein